MYFHEATPSVPRPLVMPSVSIEITRFVDDHQPGFVECILVDADGLQHTFVEKVPIISPNNLGPTSIYPCAGVVQCEVEEEWTDGAGRCLVRVNTDIPWHVESTEGVTRFVVLASQILHS
jgi:hypothetical protein